MNPASGRASRLALLVALAAVVAVLHAAGRGALAAPPLDDVGVWLEARGPLVAAMAVLRLLGLAATAWLLVVTAVAELAATVGAVRLLAATERAMPPALRRALGAVIGVGAAVSGIGAAGGPSVAGSVAPPPTVATQEAVPVDDTGPPPSQARDGAGAVATLSVASDVAAEPPVPASPTAPAAEEWTVEQGDSFWSIAAEVVAERGADTSNEAEVARYWRALIAANGDRLLGGDPDLIFPGQRLVLPS